MAENTLGAPTEGLGQNITFAVPGQAAVPQASSSGAVAVRNDMRGGEGAGANRAIHVAPPPPDQTLNVLLRMGQDIIAPKLKEAREASFVDGMQRAAAGQAVADIVDEQPWYSKVFGPTDLVDGARAYTASTKASEIATGIELAMPELRKMDGPAFSAHVSKTLGDSKTGDATADAMVATAVLKQMPHSMAAQAKNNYLYKQEVFTEAQRGAMQSALVNIGVLDHKARKGGDGQRVPGDAFMPGTISDATDETDSLLAKQAAMGAFVRPDHQDPKLHSRNVATVLAAQGAVGNLAGLYAVKDAGVIETLQPQDQVTVQHAIDSAERKTRLSIDAPLAIQASQWQTLANDPTSSPEAIVQGAKELNAQYAQLTGSRAPLVAQADTVRELVQLETTRINTQHREAARLAVATAKATKADEKQLLHNQKIEMGAAAFSAGQDFSFLQEKEVQEAWAYKRSVSTDEQYFSAMAASAERKGGVNTAFKDTLQTEINLSTSQANPQMLHDTYVKHYLPLRKAGGAQGHKVAATYTGEYAAKMDDYHRFMQATGQVSDGDRTVALLKFTQPRAKVDNSKDATELQRVAAQKGMWQTVGNLFDDKPPLDAELSQQFVSELMPYMDNLPSTLTSKEKLKEAGKLAGIEQYAGTYWKRGLDQAPIEQALVKPTRPDGQSNALQIQVTELDAAIKLGFSQQLAKVGLLDSGVSAYRMPDADGEAMFYVLSSTDKGEPNGILIRGSEIESAWATKKMGTLEVDIAAQRARMRVIASGYTAFGKTNPAKDLPPEREKLNKLLQQAGRPPE